MSRRRAMVSVGSSPGEGDSSACGKSPCAAGSQECAIGTIHQRAPAMNEVANLSAQLTVSMPTVFHRFWTEDGLADVPMGGARERGVKSL